MAGTDSYIQLPVDSTGKKVRGWWNSVGGSDVYAQAMVITDIDGGVQVGTAGVYTQGHVAHDVADAGNPLKIGGRAYTSTPSPVASGDRVDAWFDSYGKQVVALSSSYTGSDAVANTSLAAIAGVEEGLNDKILIAAPYVYNGSTWDRMRGDTTGTYVVGNVAHDVADAGNPIKVGGKYQSALPTAVTNNDRVDSLFDKYGRQFVALGYQATGADGVTNTVVGQSGFDGTATALPMMSATYFFNGSSWDRMRGNTSGIYVHGGIAHDSPDSGNPIKVGGKGVTSVPTDVTTGDRVDAWFDTKGKQAVWSHTALTAFDSLADSAFSGPFLQNSNLGYASMAGSMAYNGSNWDRMRTIESSSAAPNVKTGILAVGVGPGFDVKLNPTALAAALNSAITNTVDGAQWVSYAFGDTRTGQVIFEVTPDDTNWFTVNRVIDYVALTPVSGLITSPASGAYYMVDVAGYRQVRIRVNSGLSGTLGIKTTHHLHHIRGTGLVDAQNSGIEVLGLMGYNGATWDRVRTANTGRLQVDVITGGGGTTYVEDVAAAGGESLMLAGTVRQDTPASSNADGDYANLKTDSVGRLWVNVGAAVDTELPTAAALADGAAATPTTPTIGAIGLVYNGSTVDRQRGTAAGGTWVQGPAAHDATIAGSPVTIGGRSSDAVPSSVSADGEAVWTWLLRNGAQMMANAPHLAMVGTPFTLVSKTVQTTTAQTGTDVWTPASGKKIVITSYQIQVGGTVAGTVQLWFGANADTTYSRGTDSAIFDGEFAPSATLKPGVVQTGLWISPTADYEIHLTTSAAINPFTVTLWGYEI